MLGANALVRLPVGLASAAFPQILSEENNSNNNKSTATARNTVTFNEKIETDRDFEERVKRNGDRIQNYLKMVRNRKNNSEEREVSSLKTERESSFSSNSTSYENNKESRKFKSKKFKKRSISTKSVIVYRNSVMYWDNKVDKAEWMPFIKNINYNRSDKTSAPELKVDWATYFRSKWLVPDDSRLPPEMRKQKNKQNIQSKASLQKAGISYV